MGGSRARGWATLGGTLSHLLPWLLSACSELADSLGPGGWRDLGGYAGHLYSL